MYRYVRCFISYIAIAIVLRKWILIYPVTGKCPIHVFIQITISLIIKFT
jgi:hypothetical protein